MSTTLKLSASLEDYLEAIFHIEKSRRVARAKDIARRLNVKGSSVTGALQALAIVFGITAAVHLALLLPFWAARRALSRLTGMQLNWG